MFHQVEKAACPPHMEVAMRYAFIVPGSVPKAVDAVLPEFESTNYPTGGRAPFGPAQDESDLLTILSRITALGLSVIEVRLLPD